MVATGRTTGNSTSGRGATGAVPTAVPTIIPSISAMDTLIPQVPDVTADDIAARFQFDTLTKIEGEPDYAEMDVIRNELYRNALAVKSPFGGAKHGHLGIVMKDVLYSTEAGVAWTVPTTAGVYPAFPPTATETEKKQMVAAFIRDEKGIVTAELVEELLRNLVLDSVDEEYYMELKHSIFGYDRVTVAELLDHLFANYAKIDDNTLQANKDRFAEPPDLSKPIDVYFHKQEKCQQLAADGEVPIGEPDMVLQLQLHIGSTGMVNSAYTKWRTKPTADRTWKNAKVHFRKALKDLSAINKITAGEAGLTANATTQQATDDKVREEIVEQLGDAFDNLAMAAVAKNETMEQMVKAIADLTASNTTLVAANKKLTDHLATTLSKLSITGNSSRGGGGTSSRGSGGGTGRAKPARVQTIEAADDGKTWPAWTDPDAYCHTCGYKLKVGHSSANCRFKGNPGHKSCATRQNTMGGSKLNAGWGNAPNGE